MNEPRIVLMEAISRRKYVSARYNGIVIKLAPHLLFERHGDLFISALNASKAWRSEDERQLGQFKLAGLGDLTLIEEGFEPLAGFTQAPPKPDDTPILMI